MYLTDSMLNPKNYENPFENFGRSIFGNSDNRSFRHHRLFFRNIYVESNVGYLWDNWEKTRGNVLS